MRRCPDIMKARNKSIDGRPAIFVDPYTSAGARDGGGAADTLVRREDGSVAELESKLRNGAEVVS